MCLPDGRGRDESIESRMLVIEHGERNIVECEVYDPVFHVCNTGRLWKCKLCEGRALKPNGKGLLESGNVEREPKWQSERGIRRFTASRRVVRGNISE